MHDIWNPWHGCKKCSEGCQNCYMYYLDAQRDKDGGEIYQTKAGFRYPLSKTRSGEYKVRSGEMLRVCMTSDFFLEEADSWRDEAWDIIHQRPDVKFFLLTKRPQRVADHLPKDWGDSWENVVFNVTCENQHRTDAFLEAQKRLTLEGNIVISVGLFGHSGDDEVWTEGTKEMLDDMHKRKIDMADEIYVLNVGGYIGSSTQSEIEYAKATGKPVRYLED